MRNITSLFFLVGLSIFALKVNGQNNLPPVFEIKTDTALEQTIDDKYWQILEDPSGKLTIDQVSSAAYSSKFHINTAKTKGYNYDVTTYWLRYRFKNTTNHPIKITLREGVAYAWLYIPKGNKRWDIKKTGALVPWSERDGLKRIQNLVINLKPGEETLFYERNIFDFRFYKPKTFELRIGFAERAIDKWYVNNYKLYLNNILGALSFGLLLMAMVINLMFYRVVKEKTYLYFSGFVLFYGLDLFLSFNSRLTAEFPFFSLLFRPIILALAFYSIMHFVRCFLDTKTYTPKWDKFLIFFSFLQIIPWFSQFIVSPSLAYGNYLVVYTLLFVIPVLYFPIILITIITYFWINKKSRIAIFAILPSAFWIGIAYSYIFIVSTLNNFDFKIDTKLSEQISDLDNFANFFIFSWLAVCFSWILFKRFQDLQKNLLQTSIDREVERNQLIEQQKVELENEVEARTAELKQSLIELRTTQQQLVQSEKLASLGELTAGIAHEIQNPLNFVNNFSEVSMELAVEMKQELGNGNTEEAAALAVDIEQNLQKIIHHGKRADGIVKNMLQHSRNNSAEKELTDINKLADEYFRLSYHGLRAKDKSFNAAMRSDFDPTLPKANVVSQDFGRVLLNLFNNAFYAVQQRKKNEGESFKPEVKVSTKLDGDFIKIKVSDNGTGISDDVRGKILQPFFTTKPTGEGTGLGLSLSYDIITKGHGGKIEINSKEGEFTEFTITIPK